MENEMRENGRKTVQKRAGKSRGEAGGRPDGRGRKELLTPENSTRTVPPDARLRGEIPKDDVKTGGYAVSVEQNCAF
ncbi:MAG TPA: hypothetical protein H9860_02140 [Candidatus Gemmiger faecavium]|nr:hypothetical protein [Candidatus Gemmiger faecavium]